MRLPVPFLQLPLRFDAERLQAEVFALDPDAWRQHPLKYPGNYSLPLIAVDGDPDSDEVAGPMLPTAYLGRCPYLERVMGRLGAVWGRSRLMKLTGGAEVTPHVDTNYYWREHMRVHVPIQTSSAVHFHCGDAQVNMREGECWIFDTWRPHRVINDAGTERIHLVADTVGGDAFWKFVDRSRTHQHVCGTAWSVEDFGAQASDPSASPLMLERCNVPVVMTPWELREHLEFLFSFVQPDPGLPVVQKVAGRLVANWRGLWARFGDASDGWPEYAQLRDAFDNWLEQNASPLRLTNGTPFVRTCRAMILTVMVTRQEDGHSSAVVAPPASTGTLVSGLAQPRTDELVRPVFIVCPPRSGSSLLFETLAMSPDVCTLGDESHRMIEVETASGALGAIARGYDSNRLDAGDATAAVAKELRSRYRERVFDRDGLRRTGSIRLLEKTPKNALRIPFLSKIFPDAVFVYLYRDPRAVMASMLEAWESGRFCTYPRLPGWTGLPWSLLLIPGWRNLVGKPLPEIVAAQWTTTTRVLLDDLDALPAQRVRAIRHESLLANPDVEIRRLCNALGLAWDRELGATLPLARFTVTPPSPTKWQKRAHEVLPLMQQLAEMETRAEHSLERWTCAAGRSQAS